MSSPTAELQRTWRRVVGVGHDDEFYMLVARHAEPHRRYHTAVHVMWVLRHVEAMLADDEFLAVDGDAVRLAALFHDLVYDPRSSTNEADSSRLAVAFAHALGWRSERRALVGSLIEATAHHRADTDDAIVLLDADLAILGSDPASYQAYVAGVRGEYAHLPEAEWRAGRSAVLRHFLGLSELFRSSYLRSKEQRARANMAAELAALGR